MFLKINRGGGRKENGDNPQKFLGVEVKMVGREPIKTVCQALASVRGFFRLKASWVVASTRSPKVPGCTDSVEKDRAYTVTKWCYDVILEDHLEKHGATHGSVRLSEHESMAKSVSAGKAGGPLVDDSLRKR